MRNHSPTGKMWKDLKALPQLTCSNLGVLGRTVLRLVSWWAAMRCSFRQMGGGAEKVENQCPVYTLSGIPDMHMIALLIEN